MTTRIHGTINHDALCNHPPLTRHRDVEAREEPTKKEDGTSFNFPRNGEDRGNVSDPAILRSASCIHDDDSSDDSSLAIDDDDDDDGDDIKELCSGELVSKLQRNRRPKGGKTKGKDEARGCVSRNGKRDDDAYREGQREPKR